MRWSKKKLDQEVKTNKERKKETKSKAKKKLKKIINHEFKFPLTFHAPSIHEKW